MSKPYFNTGQTIEQVADEAGIPHRVAQNIINRYKIPAACPTPASLLAAVHKSIQEYDKLGIKRNRRHQIMKKHGLKLREPKAKGNGAAPEVAGDDIGLAKAVRAVIKHPRFAYVFGIDCRDELTDFYMKAADRLMEEHT